MSVGDLQGQGEARGTGRREGGTNTGSAEGQYDATGVALQQLNGTAVGGATPRGGRPPSRDHFTTGVRVAVYQFMSLTHRPPGIVGFLIYEGVEDSHSSSHLAKSAPFSHSPRLPGFHMFSGLLVGGLLTCCTSTCSRSGGQLMSKLSVMLHMRDSGPCRGV